MAECYINLEFFDQARVSLNILHKLIKMDKSKRASTWCTRVESKLKEIEMKHNRPLNSHTGKDQPYSQTKLKTKLYILYGI